MLILFLQCLFAGTFLKLILLLQGYSKYGEVVQGLTRFFWDKAPSDPIKMEQNDRYGKTSSSKSR
jgi:hypothetical protein